MHKKVRQRISYKTAELARRANTTGVPAYLKEHLVQRVPSRQTRSAASPLLFVPRLTTDFARRSFSYAAPVIWNSLPTEVMLCNILLSPNRLTDTTPAPQQPSVGIHGAL